MNKVFFSSLILAVLCLSKVWAKDPKVLVLDNFHLAASEANFESYFNLLSEHAIFLGTDGAERWTKKEFMDYVKPHFERGNGWTYIASERKITETTLNSVFIFDEKLFNEKYGYCRGTGVLIKNGSEWKIAQYNLSIPVPNAIALDVVKQIQKHGQPKDSVGKTVDEKRKGVQSGR